MSATQAAALKSEVLPPQAGAAQTTLLSPYRLGELELRNRLVMSPMTRSRALEGNVPNPLAATYYAQRASAGLIVTEATQVSPQGVGYIRTPGIHSAGTGCGLEDDHRCRASSGRQDLRPALARRARVASRFSRRRAARRPLRPAGGGRGVHDAGTHQVVTPRALETDELPGIVAQFRTAAENAKAAGFRRRRVAWRQWLSAGPVPARRLQPAHRRLRRQHRETARAFRSKSPTRSPACGGRNAWDTSSHPIFPDIRCRTPIRSRRFHSWPRN